MALQQHAGITSPTGLMWALCGWNKLPTGREDDCNELLDDPLARLSKGSIEFSTLGLRMYRVWLPMLLLAEGLLKLLVFDRARHEGDLFIYWAGTFGVLAIYVIVPMLVLTRRLRFDLHGFHIIQGRKDLFVPWAALIHGRDWNIGVFQIRIPVIDTAKDTILVTVDAAVSSISDGASPFGLKFENPTEINLTWPFNLDPRIFVEVAKQLCSNFPSKQANLQRGNANPTRSPATSPAPHSHDEVLAGIKHLPSGAIQVPVSAVTFPPVCCRCGVETFDLRSIHARARHYWWFPSRMGATLQMPVCNGCWKSSWIKCLTVIFSLEVIWTLLITYAVFGSLDRSWQVYFIVALLAVMPARFVLFWLPSLWWRVADVVLNRPTNEFRFRFANSGYHEHMLEHIRLRDEIG